VILADGEVSTRLRLDPADARFLGSALDHLPGGDDQHSPVTLDLNGRIAVRASAADQPQQVTELILDRPRYTGDPLCIVTNRAFVERALRLGQTEFGFAGSDSPFVCRDDQKTFTVQPLGAGSPLEADVDMTRIESSSADGGEGRAPARNESTRKPTPEAVRLNGHASPRPAEANGHTSTRRTESTSPNGTEQPTTSLAALIQEAEAPHAALADAKSRTARLISGLRRQRRQSRLVQETLRSLRELKLQDVVAWQVIPSHPAGESPDSPNVRGIAGPVPRSLTKEVRTVSLKLNVGVSRKVGQPDYGSIGASCNLELEISSDLLERDLDGFQARARSAYVAAHQAVHDELARL
jgi:hypothetical protein